MCGFVVWVERSQSVVPQRFADALALLRHRGPDAQRLCFVSSPERLHLSPVYSLGQEFPASPQHIGIGHTRLSILDLSAAAHQPFISREGRHCLLYNGEIYNYIEHASRFSEDVLAEDNLSSRGDTAVLFAGLIQEGLSTLQTMNGMWAFAFFDFAKRRISLSRDRYGKKPLFYYHDPDRFIASSEPKSIFAILQTKRQLNHNYLSAFLISKLTPQFEDGQTPYAAIRMLSPGSHLIFDLDSFSATHHRDNAIRTCIPASQDSTGLRDDLAVAVSERMRSDVPIGIQISGGVDSTVIAAYAMKHLRQNSTHVRCYTVLNTEADGSTKSDLHYARMVAQDLGIPLTEIALPQDESGFLRDYRTLTKQYEYPINPFLIAHSGHLMNQQMAADGVKVILDGTGGDEVLGGYPSSYQAVAMNNAHMRHLWDAFRYIFMSQKFYGRKLMPRVQEFLHMASLALLPRGKNTTTEEHAFRGLTRFAKRDVFANDCTELLRSFFVRNTFVDIRDSQMFEIERFLLPYALYVSDQNSMMHSMENRSPLLDFRLAKYVAVPVSEKMKDGYNKYFLRKAIPDTIRNEVRWRKGKGGMGYGPLRVILNHQKAISEQVLSSSLVGELFDTSKLEHLRKETSAGGLFILRQLFSLALLGEAYECVVS
jgi:asparagine synthase (glutamine-hydrolysing)